MAERSTSTVFGAFGGLVAALIVALVSTWMGAEADRAEALRQERRSAYADFIGRAQSCETNALLNDIRGAFGDGIQGDSVKTPILTAAFKECLLALQSSLATVTLLTESDEIVVAGNKVVRSTIAVAGIEGSSEEPSLPDRPSLTEDYIRDLSTFQALARESATESVLSPFLVPLLGYVLVNGLLLFAFANWLRRSREERRETNESET